MEIWKDIPGYEGQYQVSNFGRAKALNKRTHTSSPYLFLVHAGSNNAYKALDLHKNNVRKRQRIHHLVAKLFIGPPPSPLHEINHKDGNPGNNHVDNLEWCTKSENHIHRVRVLGKDTLAGSRRIVPVAVVTPAGETFNFNSITEACTTLNLRLRSVFKVLHGEQKTHRGHRIYRLIS